MPVMAVSVRDGCFYIPKTLQWLCARWLFRCPGEKMRQLLDAVAEELYSCMPIPKRRLRLEM